MSKGQRWTRWIRPLGAALAACVLLGQFDFNAAAERARSRRANFRRLQVTAGTEYSDSPDPWRIVKGSFKHLRVPDFREASNFTLASTLEYVEQTPLAEYLLWIGDVLVDPHQKQIVWGVLFTLLGLVITVTGAQVWEYLFPLLVGLFCAGFVFYEEVLLQSFAGEDTRAQGVVVLQVCVTLALATYSGFDGTQLLVGAALGLLGSWVTSSCLAHVEQQHPGAIMIWCCFGSFLGALMLIHEGRGFYLATLLPLLGSYLVVVGLGTAASSMDVGGVLPEHTSFVQVAQLLLGNSGAYGVSCVGFLGAAGALRHRLAGFQPELERSQVDKQAAAFGAVGIIGMMLATTTGFGCQLVNRCPAWLVPVDEKAWPLVGGLAWALLAFLGALAQLANASDIVFLNVDARDTEKLARRRKRNTISSGSTRGSRW